MKDYKKILLNKLIDSYENSSVYKEDNVVAKNIYFRFNNRNLKEYFDEYDYIYREEIDIACSQLEKDGLIKIYFGKGMKSHLIEKIQLEFQKLSEVYQYLNRTEKRKKEHELIILIDKYCENEQLRKFGEYIKQRLKDNMSVKKYFDIDKINECSDILKGLYNVTKQNKEIFKRNFSINLYGDSKRYEKFENKIKSIIEEFTDEEYSTFNIIDNYTYVSFKGCIKFKLGNSYIDADDFKGGIALSSLDVENIEEVHITCDKLVTIENLTSFNNFKEKYAVIYLGGYHNSVRQKLLTKIYDQNPDVHYYHFGDIDAGGFKILVNLKNKTKIPFKPLNMNSDILMNYLNYAKDLTEHDVIEVKRLLENDDYKEYSETLKALLKYNKKIEQEILC